MEDLLICDAPREKVPFSEIILGLVFMSLLVWSVTIDQETVMQSLTRLRESSKKRKVMDMIQDLRQYLEGLWQRYETLDKENLYFDILDRFNVLIAEIKGRDPSTSGHSSSSSLIVSNANLQDAQKLHYPKSSLTNKAARLVKHLSIAKANFLSAWEMFNKRYENKRVIIN
ncbi:uncharacterized protein LOC127285700 [Leptopilina boulardi]|uniref:uncharacterized protein LOC127285700 n=1 Tax=Leptopilina boulardi TaxID=63433 RepID=UPI0021F5A37A|nr:uncharacterized protein LOC127285700 [Leptopilina boulardi]